MPKIRLFVEAPLGARATVALTREQAHYLTGVMRRGPGDTVLLFNGRDGEWTARLAAADRKGAVLEVEALVRAQAASPDLWLLFAPLRKQRTDFVVEKATELGVSRLVPVFTRHTNAERVRTDRMRAQAVEAAEQCERLDVPAIAEPAPLPAAVEALGDRPVLACLERHGARPLAALAAPGPAAILVGPEGGFADDEAAWLAERPAVRPVSLGPRILRADTAAVAALALWQALAGDARGALGR